MSAFGKPIFNNFSRPKASLKNINRLAFLARESYKISNMKVCYFGTYEKNYPRNRNVINGLKLNGVSVIECHEPLLEKIENKINTNSKVKANIILTALKSYAKLIIKRFGLPKVDCIIVGYLGQVDMLLARLLFPGKKIIFNPMISIFDTMVKDRQIGDNFFTKKFFFYLDKLSCRLADKIILDTREHAEYFKKEFKISSKKIGFVYIGADENFFYPLAKKNNSNNEFKILFYGKFSPLQGIEVLIKAAKILEKDHSIKFEIIGQGQTYDKIIKLSKNLNSKNINFIDWIPFEKLIQKINSADICIGGHFGDSKKAKRVVANKVFQIIASGKAIIISDSQSSRSAGFQHKKNSMFSKIGDAEGLADIILQLKNDSELRAKIENNAYLLFKKKFSLKKTGEKFKIIIESLF